MSHFEMTETKANEVNSNAKLSSAEEIRPAPFNVFPAPHYVEMPKTTILLYIRYKFLLAAI